MSNSIPGERLLTQERLILDATEMIIGLLQAQRVSRQELAQRLGKSKGFVSQLLSGERNMTLRTLADIGYALGRTFSLTANGGLVSVPASELRAGDQVLLRADQVLGPNPEGKTELVGVNCGPFLAEQEILRARHADGS